MEEKIHHEKESVMNERKELGKIQNVKFGIGGYQDACLGIFFTLGGDHWGVCTDKSAWDCNLITVSDRSQWTEADRSRQYDEILRYVSGLLKEAKVDDVSRLVGKPIEATFDGMTLKSWRILMEVL
jgi:hypothetical protein